MESLRHKALESIAQTQNIDDIHSLRTSLLGKKGELTGLMKSLAQLSPEEKKEQGKALNLLKQELSQALDTKFSAFKKAELDKKLASEWQDLSLPIRPIKSGKIHPITQTMDELIQIFGKMGFTLKEGPEIETDHYNFSALNIPESHPARQMHDTFYMNHVEAEQEYVLRTHTSPVQIRSMESSEPPIQIIAPGRTYRSDYDLTHTPMFHQVEALMINESVTMAELKGCIHDFCREFFENDDLPIRFRSSYFPFTEPSAEVDIGCYRQNNQLMLGQAPKGQKQDWLEIMGCGMVHRKVLEHSNIDPDKYQGFAFGMGIERIAMLKYGIPDLRSFFETDYRWLQHYGFLATDVPRIK